MKKSVYTTLSNVSFLSKSYTFKFLFIAFLGIHIPLIGLICYLIFYGPISAISIFTVTLVLTLGATAITLLILNSLLTPLQESKKALQNYLTDRSLPQLPVNFKDEAGILMQKVQETLTKLDKLLEEKKDLIALISHDLRSPLSTVKTLASIIMMPEVTPERLSYISNLITKSVDKQVDMFNTILQHLRHDDWEWMKLNLNETELSEIIKASLKDVQQPALEKNIDVQVNNEYNGVLKADGSIFPQVIKNLLSNSIKFSHPGSVVQLKALKSGDQIRIEIADSGIGFEPGDADLLFEKFTTKGKVGTVGEQSTGMGLYLSKKIVEAHNGTLTAKSAGVNQGSTFIIEISG